MHFSRNTRLVVAAVCALALMLVMLVSVESASAVPTQKGDRVSISLGKKGKGLRVRGVRIRAIKPAKLRGTRLVLPVSDVASPRVNRSQLVLPGGMTLKSGKRRVKIRGFLVKVTGRRVSVTAKVGRSRLTVFSGRTDSRTKITFSPAALKLSVSRLKLTRRGASKLKKSLANRGIKARVLGRTTGKASAFIAPFVPGANTGNNGANNPSNAALPEAAPPIARPVSAVNITGANVRWWVRDSWVTYTAEGSFEPQVIAPATAYPAQTEGSHHCSDGGSNPSAEHLFSFNLPFAHGWYDAASSTAAIYTAGGVRFYRPDRGIDITSTQAELEFNGAASRSVLTFTEAGLYANRRGLLGALTLGSYVPAPGGPNTFRVVLPASAAAGVFAGQYAPGVGFGCFEVSFTA